MNIFIKFIMFIGRFFGKKKDSELQKSKVPKDNYPMF
jgi:hypothetical protein